MKVYIVERDYDYEGSSFEGAFSTHDLAEAYADTQRPHTGATIVVSEVEVDHFVPVPVRSTDGGGK